MPPSLHQEDDHPAALTVSARNEERVLAVTTAPEDGRATERTVAEVSCPAKIPT